MRRKLAILAALLLPSSAAQSHALFPGQQTVHTVGERGIAYFQAVNGRSDVSEYRVELFDYENWAATRHAVPSVEKIVVPTAQSSQLASGVRRFTVMVDLDGRPERTIRVCTKSVAGGNPLRPATTSVNTRVCSKLVVRRVQ